jgi:hypothetical protein
MPDLRAENDQPVSEQDSGAYEPPCAEDVEVAGGTTEAASGIAVIPPSSK